MPLCEALGNPRVPRIVFKLYFTFDCPALALSQSSLSFGHMREEGLLTVGVADWAFFHQLGPTHRSQKNPLTLLHALYEELSHPVGFAALLCDPFVVQLTQSQKAEVL